MSEKEKNKLPFPEKPFKVPKRRVRTVKNNFIEFTEDDVKEPISTDEDWRNHIEVMQNEVEELVVDATVKSDDIKYKKNPDSQDGDEKSIEKIAKNSKMWRKTVMTNKKIQLLYMAFCMNYSDRQAVLYAWISEKTLYNYQDKNPDFLQHKALLKETTKMYAKTNIFKSLMAWDVENSKWLLERLEKDQYSRKDVVENTGTVTVSDPLRQRLIEMKAQKKQLAESQKKKVVKKKTVATTVKPKKKRVVIVKK